MCTLYTYTYNVVYGTLGWVILALVLISISKSQLLGLYVYKTKLSHTSVIALLGSIGQISIVSVQIT